jgi:hypothetical protein
MVTTPYNIGEWPQLTRVELESKLSDAVRHRFQDTQFWAEVRATMQEHPVLAGHLRGLLSQLEAISRGTRDERFWHFRINQVRPLLAPDRLPAPGTAANPQPMHPPSDPPPSSGGRRPRGTRRSVHTAGRLTTGVAAIEFQAPVPTNPTTTTRRSARH